MAKNENLTLPMAVPSSTPAKPFIKSIGYPIWTYKKAKLVQRYLKLFIQITKHGTYIDGFAGPQQENHDDMWAAELVLEIEPKWLRHFYLYDTDSRQIAALNAIARKHRSVTGQRRMRDIRVRGCLHLH